MAGCVGALVKIIVNDGYLTLPKFEEGKFYLGFIGSTIIGGIVGVIVDHNIVTAFLAGYVGYSLIDNILKYKFNSLNNNITSKENAKGLRDNNSSGSGDSLQ